jgi:CheR methyltransferase, SAM binding domain
MIDTANALPGWEIVGLDLALPAYLVHDERKSYAVFDDGGRATYFQPGAGSAAGDWLELMEDWEGSKKRFESLLQMLIAERTRQGSNAETFEHDGATFETNPPQAYERPNLHFVRSTLEAAEISGADVVRCFNMLYYFDDAFRTSALRSFERILGEDGLLVCGGNWVYSTTWSRRL